MSKLLYIAQRLAVAGFFTLAELGLAGLFGAPQVGTLHARLTAYMLTFLFLLTIPDPPACAGHSKVDDDEDDHGSEQERGQTNHANHAHLGQVEAQKTMSDALKHRM